MISTGHEHNCALCRLGMSTTVHLCTGYKIFYPTLTLKRRLSWPVERWKSDGMLGRVVKVGKKVGKALWGYEKKTLLGRLWLFGKGKNRLLFGRPWNAVITSRHKMEMKYGDKGTLVQRQRYPLPSRSLQYWPMNHCVRNTTRDVQCLKIFVFENIFDNCFVTICHFWFQNIFDNFCHFLFENMFDNCFVTICHLSPYLHKLCLISWQNLFMKHFKFLLWLVREEAIFVVCKLCANEGFACMCKEKVLI